MAARKVHFLPIGHPSVEQAFAEIVRQLEKAASTAYDKNNKQVAFTLFEMLDDLRPNPNTGSFDAFWSSLRRQQPALVNVPNPTYDKLQIRLNETQGKSELDRIRDPWKSLIMSSAEALSESV